MEAAGSWLRDAPRIREALRGIAGEFVSYASALAVASAVRLEAGNVDAMAKSCHGKTVEETQALVGSRAAEELERLGTVLDADAVNAKVATTYAELATAVANDDESWKALVPGKQILGTFAGRAQVKESRAKAMYLDAAAKSDRRPFEEIERLFDEFAAL